MYSFVVISYNEEKYILETLESIRYQIEKYGQGRTYQLIIADDNSKDRTRELIDKWLSRYSSLFQDVNQIYQYDNVGTCKNIADAMRTIKGSLFISTAGDDLIAPVDVFTVLEDNSDVDVLTNIPIMMKDNGKIYTDKRKYRDALAQATYTSEYVNWAVALGCPIQAGASWHKRLNTYEVLSFMEKFKLLDDRPRYYAIWRNNKKIKYRFVNIPLLIYRKNENSVSQLNGMHHGTINQDLKNYYDECISNEKDVIYKLLIILQKQSANLRVNGWKGYFRYLTPFYLVEQCRRLAYSKKCGSIFEEFKNKYIEDTNGYYKTIRENAIRLGE